jgi:ribonuclease HI
MAITGAFRTVAAAVAEAEASIHPIRERHAQAAVRLWINIHTLPKAHPLALKKIRMTARFTSPLQKIAQVAEGARVDHMETIQEYALPPWEPRLRPTIEFDRVKATERANKASGIVIATSSSAKKGMVGIGGVARDTLFNRTSEIVAYFSVTLGTMEEQNPYTAELAAIATALENLLASVCHRHITIVTRNQSALTAMRQPRQQSGQGTIRQIYELTRLHQQRGNLVDFLWIPAESDFALGAEAKAAAQRATKQGHAPRSQMPQAKSTAIRLAIARQRHGRALPEGVGKFSQALDAALPGKHTRDLYDKLKRKEACVLAQLRTGMVRLNGFLSRIGAVESDTCACGQARETVEHFLFRCVRWTDLREGMLQCSATRRGNLSFYLGGKAPSDPKEWSPNMKAVRETIKYAIATGRLNLDEERGQQLDQSQ